MIDTKKLEKIMELMIKYELDVVEAESGREKFSLARNVSASQLFSQRPATSGSMNAFKDEQIPLSNSQGSSHEASTKPAQPHAPTTPPAGTIIKSPFVGTFYRSPGPDAKPFVEIGSRVKKGQSLCIVEAMKLMNTIEAEADGEIVDILVENGKPVEFELPLMIIKT